LLGEGGQDAGKKQTCGFCAFFHFSGN